MAGMNNLLKEQAVTSLQGMAGFYVYRGFLQKKTINDFLLQALALECGI